MLPPALRSALPWSVLLAASGCAFGPRVWVEEEQQITVRDVGALHGVRCTTHNGRIAVEGHAGDAIEVVVRKRAGGDDEDDARAALAALEVVRDRVDDHLVLGWRWLEPRRAHWGQQVSFAIRMPDRMDLVAETHNGDVAASGTSGACRMRTHNGDVRSDGRGALTAATHNGDVDAATAAGAVDIETHNGSVHLALRDGGTIAGRVATHNGRIVVDAADRSGGLACSTHNGGISCDRELSGRLQTSRSLTGWMGGAVAEDGPVLSITSHNGSIAIR